MKDTEDTAHIVVSRAAHELIRNVAFMERKTMRRVVEEALTIAYADKYLEIALNEEVFKED